MIGWKCGETFFKPITGRIIEKPHQKQITQINHSSKNLSDLTLQPAILIRPGPIFKNVIKASLFRKTWIVHNTVQARQLEKLIWNWRSFLKMPKTNVPIDEGQVLFDVRRVFTLKAFNNSSKSLHPDSFTFIKNSTNSEFSCDFVAI